MTYVYGEEYYRTKSALTRWLIFTVASLVCLLFLSVYGSIKSKYEWQLMAGSQWNLADRSSTLDAKYKYINSFVLSLESMKEKHMLSEYNALFLKTPQNKTENNIKAIKTLQERLYEIIAMDTKSFEYNQAIQQITSQEQGEATELINDLFGSFQIHNYWYAWDWIFVVFWFTTIILFFGIVILALIRFGLYNL